MYLDIFTGKVGLPDAISGPLYKIDGMENYAER
jgi:hypothetical protein